MDYGMGYLQSKLVADLCVHQLVRPTHARVCMYVFRRASQSVSQSVSQPVSQSVSQSASQGLQAV